MDTGLSLRASELRTKLHQSGYAEHHLLSLTSSTPLESLKDWGGHLASYPEALEYWSCIFLQSCEVSESPSEKLTFKDFLSNFTWATYGASQSPDPSALSLYAELIDDIISDEITKLDQNDQISEILQLIQAIKTYEVKFNDYNFIYLKVANISMNNLFTKINKLIDAQKPPEGIVEVAEQLEVSSRLGLDVQDLAFVLADLVNDFVDTLVENWQNPSMGNVDLNDAKQALLVCNKLDEFVGSESKVIVEECIEKLKVFRIDLSSNLAHVQTPPQSPKPSNQPPPPPSDLYIIDKSLVKIEYPPKYTVTHGNLRTNIHYATYHEGIVCVKTYEFLDSIQNYEKAYNEIRIYERLSKLANNNNCFLLYYGTFIEGNKIYMVMEYYESNLMIWINYFETNNRWLDEDMFLNIAWKVLDSFNIMVQNGILHGDIKPQNMLADHNWNIKIIDFNASLTKIQEVALLNTGFHVVKGTLGYMAPELKAAFAVNQEKTNYNMEKSDVYSLGVVFYQLLTHQNIDELKADYMQAVIKNFQGFCNDTKNFLILLLTEDRHARPTFGEALASFKKIPATKTFTFSQQKST